MYHSHQAKASLALVPTSIITSHASSPLALPTSSQIILHYHHHHHHRMHFTSSTTTFTTTATPTPYHDHPFPPPVTTRAEGERERVCRRGFELIAVARGTHTYSSFRFLSISLHQGWPTTNFLHSYLHIFSSL